MPLLVVVPLNAWRTYGIEKQGVVQKKLLIEYDSLDHGAMIGGIPIMQHYQTAYDAHVIKIRNGLLESTMIGKGGKWGAEASPRLEDFDQVHEALIGARSPRPRTTLPRTRVPAPAHYSAHRCVQAAHGSTRS